MLSASTAKVMMSAPVKIPESYRRYIANGLRERFGFRGAPIRLRFTARKRERAR